MSLIKLHNHATMTYSCVNKYVQYCQTKNDFHHHADLHHAPDYVIEMKMYDERHLSDLRQSVGNDLMYLLVSAVDYIGVGVVG